MRTDRSGSSRLNGRTIFVILPLALLAVLFIWGAKWGGFASLSPLILLLLLCPVMHFFMHGGHGHSSSVDREQRPDGSAEIHRH